MAMSVKRPAAATAERNRKIQHMIEQEKAQDDQRHIDRRIRQQQGAQDAPRIFQQPAQPIRQMGVLLPQPAQLQWLERKKRRLDGGEKG